MDWSVFLPALAANLVGQLLTGSLFWVCLIAYRNGRARWKEAQEDEGASDVFPFV